MDHSVMQVQHDNRNYHYLIVGTAADKAGIEEFLSSAYIETPYPENIHYADIVRNSNDGWYSVRLWLMRPVDGSEINVTVRNEHLDAYLKRSIGIRPNHSVMSYLLVGDIIEHGLYSLYTQDPTLYMLIATYFGTNSERLYLIIRGDSPKEISNNLRDLMSRRVNSTISHDLANARWMSVLDKDTLMSDRDLPLRNSLVNLYSKSKPISYDDLDSVIRIAESYNGQPVVVYCEK